MKRNYMIGLCSLLWLLQACTLDEQERFDLGVNKVGKIALSADHRQLIADGVSKLTFNPSLYQEYSYTQDNGVDTTVYGLIPDDRIVNGEVKYFMEDGTPVAGDGYTTKDISKSELKFYATFGELMSDTFKVQIRAPFQDNQYEEIVYPIVFHIIQSTEQNDLGQGLGTDIIYHVMNLVNNAFSREVSRCPNGANAKIHFELAVYDPKGNKMPVSGINRYPMSKDDLNAITDDKIMSNEHICWDYKKYLNVWLVAEDATMTNYPRFILNFADLNEIKGITPTPMSLEEIEAETLELRDIGMKFYVTDFAIEEYSYTTEFGKFFGLLKSENNDYCDDTFAYKNYRNPGETTAGSNSRLKITKNDPIGVKPLIFYSVNIMDGSSYKNTISMDQVKRIRTITEYCPHRWAYKSKWAFTGKEE